MAERNTDIQHSIRVKIGDAEFEASGAESTVQKQYEAFLRALGPTTARDSQQQGDPGESHGKQSTGTTHPLDAHLRKVFSIKGDDVSLLARPRGAQADADALLMILWGYSHLKNTTTVVVTDLKRSAKQSGLQVERIDRVISPHAQYYVVAGTRKGTKYTLNNPGDDYAKRLIDGVLGETGRTGTSHPAA
jgi:hypothetical protein